MKYIPGDQVKLNTDYNTPDGVYDKGSKGIIKKVFPTLELYQVEFDDYQKQPRVPEEDLDPA